MYTSYLVKITISWTTNCQAESLMCQIYLHNLMIGNEWPH